MLLIIQELVPLSFVEAPLFWRFVLKQNFGFNFPSRWVLGGGLLPKVARKIKENFVSPSLASYYIYIMSFDLWMSKVDIFDTFVLIIQFLNDKWEPCNVTEGCFEIQQSTWSVLALQLNDLFAKHKLNGHVLTYVKDEGNNISTLIWSYFNCVLSNSRDVNSFCRCLLGPCHV